MRPPAQSAMLLAEQSGGILMRSGAWIHAGTAALLLAACGSETGKKTPASDPAQGEYVIDETTGETRMAIKVPGGTASLRSGAKVPLSLPDGFTLFPRAKVVTNTVVEQPGGQRTMVAFETDAPPDEVIAHYRREAAAAGFAIEVVLDAGGTLTIGGTRASDRATFSLTASEGTPTTAQLTIGSGGGG